MIKQHHIAVLYICRNRAKCINIILVRDVSIFIAPNFCGPNPIHIKCANFGHIFLPLKHSFHSHSNNTCTSHGSYYKDYSVLECDTEDPNLLCMIGHVPALQLSFLPSFPLSISCFSTWLTLLPSR